MKVIIIGGGVIGLCTAYYLNNSGANVEVVDQGDMEDGCSYGNAGYICPSHFIPLASPGMVREGIRHLLNPESPFYLKPRLNIDLIRWCWIFYRHANQHNVDRSVESLRDMSLLSRTLFGEISQSIDISLVEEGITMVYQTDHGEKETIGAANLANHLGIEARILEMDELNSKDPQLQFRAKGGVYYPQDAHLTPAVLMSALKQHLSDAGVNFRTNTRVNGVDMKNGSIGSLRVGKERIDGDAFVLTAGTWTSQLMKAIGIRMPIQAGKGYRIALKDPEIPITNSYILEESKVAVTPMRGHLQFAGTMELAGIDTSINPVRVRGIARAVERFMPQFTQEKLSIGELWSGLRPVSPDGLPYIGRAGKIKNLFVGAGHAMVGLSLATGTGKVLEEMVNGKNPSADLSIFSPNRFSN